MPIRVKLDEDLSPLVGEPLRRAGYKVASVFEQGWSGMKDAELWPLIVDEGMFLVTADKGFGDIRAFPPGSHPGILILRPDRESIIDYRELVVQVVESHTLESLFGTITVATPRKIRIRRKRPDSSAT
jgi:predicted nuclease of predicted toxin-antitoxin system